MIINAFGCLAERNGTQRSTKRSWKKYDDERNYWLDNKIVVTMDITSSQYKFVKFSSSIQYKASL